MSISVVSLIQCMEKCALTPGIMSVVNRSVLKKKIMYEKI
jgi:hypothetical protein